MRTYLLHDKYTMKAIVQSPLIILLTLTLLINIALFTSSSVYAFDPDSTLYVDDDNIEGPWDGSLEHPYQFIQDAVDAAAPQDTVFIQPGFYLETVTIATSLHLVGSSTYAVIVDGNYTDNVITITARNTTISSLTIRHSGASDSGAGVMVLAKNISINDCLVYRTKTGVIVDHQRKVTISDCIFHTNGEGIVFNHSNSSTIASCKLHHTSIGLGLYHSRSISIDNTFIHTCGVGVQCETSSWIWFEDCSISNNNDNRNGIYLKNSEIVYIQNSHIRHNGMGIRIDNSQRIRIYNCDISWNTHYGLAVWATTTDVWVDDCDIRENFRYGIHIEDESQALVTQCNIVDNLLYGIYCDNATCEAPGNYWGTIVGPFTLEFLPGDRVTRALSSYRPAEQAPLMNVGCSWLYDQTVVPLRQPFERYEPLPFEGEDTDNDLIPNWWEINFGYDPFTWNDHTSLDPDHDGLTNDEECYTYQWGSHPFLKDVFLEIDWVESQHPSDPSNKPSEALLQELRDIFASHAITLHIDTGNLGGGEMIPYISGFSYPTLRDLYWDYFLHNNMNAYRKGIFHYGLVCDRGPGAGFMFMGWDHLDSFCIAGTTLKQNQPDIDRELLIVGGAVHELGHTLGLMVDDHGGNDNMGVTELFSVQWWKHRNYRSCMNYYHTYKTLSYSDGTHGYGDFDDWDHIEFSFFKDSHLEWPKIEFPTS